MFFFFDRSRARGTKTFHKIWTALGERISHWLLCLFMWFIPFLPVLLANATAARQKDWKLANKQPLWVVLSSESEANWLTWVSCNFDTAIYYFCSYI